MRKVHALAVAITGALMATAAAAQDAPAEAQIAAALGGTPATAAEDDGSVLVGDERGFSLARATPAGSTSVARPAQTRAPLATAPVRKIVQRRNAVEAGARPSAQPGAGAARPALDMQLSFANGSAVLDAAAKRRIDPFAAALTKPNYGLTTSTFRVEGHTNSVGTRAANLELSRRRAQAVVDYLVSKGVPASRLVSQGFGPDAPIAGTRASDAANRRVEIVRN